MLKFRNVAFETLFAFTHSHYNCSHYNYISCTSSAWPSVTNIHPCVCIFRGNNNKKAPPIKILIITIKFNNAYVVNLIHSTIKFQHNKSKKKNTKNTKQQTKMTQQQCQQHQQIETENCQRQ